MWSIKRSVKRRLNAIMEIEKDCDNDNAVAKRGKALIDLGKEFGCITTQIARHPLDVGLQEDLEARIRDAARTQQAGRVIWIAIVTALISFISALASAVSAAVAWQALK